MREAAIAAIVTNLRAITIANGYTLDIGNVIRLDDKERIARTGYPALMVTDDYNEERFPKAGGYADVYFVLSIKGIVIDRLNQSTKMNALDAAVKKAINADRTLGGTVANVSIMPRLDTNLDGNETDTFFVRQVQVFYVANEANGE